LLGVKTVGQIARDYEVQVKRRQIAV
jgi:hypothetical protein